MFVRGLLSRQDAATTTHRGGEGLRLHVEAVGRVVTGGAKVVEGLGVHVAELLLARVGKVRADRGVGLAERLGRVGVGVADDELAGHPGGAGGALSLGLVLGVDDVVVDAVGV